MPIKKITRKKGLKRESPDANKIAILHMMALMVCSALFIIGKNNVVCNYLGISCVFIACLAQTIANKSIAKRYAIIFFMIATLVAMNALCNENGSLDLIKNLNNKIKMFEVK